MTLCSKYRALTFENFNRLFGATVLAASARSPCLHGRGGRERIERVALVAVVGAERTGGGEETRHERRRDSTDDGPFVFRLVGERRRRGGRGGGGGGRQRSRE